MIEVGPVGSLSFRIAGAMISITCLFYTTVMRTNKKRKLRSRLFDALLILTLIGCITNIIAEVAINSDHSFTCRLIISYVCKYVYYRSHMLVIPVFWLYITIVCDVYHTIPTRRIRIRLIPAIILELLVLSNPVTNWVFKWDEHLRYSRGPAITFAYIVSAAYLIFCFYLLAKYWQCMHVIQKVALFYFLGLAIIGAMIQMVFPDIKCELMAEAIGFLGMMVMIENDDGRTDYKTNAWNRTALVQDIKKSLLIKRDFHIICVRIVNAEAYRRIMGFANYDAILSGIADFLNGLEFDYDAYRPTGGNFFLLCPDATPAGIKEVLDKIENRFMQSWELPGGSMNIKVKVFCARCPEEFDNIDDILLFSDAEMDETDKVVYTGQDLDFLIRRVEIEKAIVRGFNEGNFQVMYRPVYHKDSMMIVSAEALLTLKDSVLGEIPFREFNAVAERTGFSVELQDRMTESVIKFIQAGIARNNAEDDPRVIAMHITSVQVLKHDYVAKVKEYIERYKVDPRYIVFDVSDKILLQAQDVIESVQDQFREMGINFFMINNDPGLLGFNPESIDKFTGIVINVARHYGTTDEEQADEILMNRCNMVKELGKSVIFMRVDTKELFERIKDMPADLIMGDYLSEKVSKSEIQTKFWHKETFYDKTIK